MRKKIAVTQRLIENPTYFEIRDALDVNQSKFLEQAGYLPVPLSAACDPESYFSQIGFDGVFLSGGNDLSCVSDDPLSAQRDQFEKRVIELALERKIPIFGVCRGMQIIADYFGGELEKVENHVAVRHKLVVQSESRFADFIGRFEDVNSYHGYAVKSVPNDFHTVCESDDDVIEAIEHKTLPIFAQMWHSERESPFIETDAKITRMIFG